MDNWRLNKLKAFLKADPKDEFSLYALSQEYMKQGDYKEAIHFFLQLKSLNPDYVGLYYHLAKAYNALEQADDALATYDEGIMIAKKLGDHHALSELQNARMNLEIEL